MRVVIVEPDKRAFSTDIENSLASMQEVVGGYIEIIPAESIVGGEALPGDKYLLVLNEEGKLQNLEPNFLIHDGADVIFGTAFVCKARDDEMVGLSKNECFVIAGLFDGIRVKRDRPAGPGTASSKTNYDQSINPDSDCQDAKEGSRWPRS